MFLMHNVAMTRQRFSWDISIKRESNSDVSLHVVPSIIASIKIFQVYIIIELSIQPSVRLFVEYLKFSWLILRSKYEANFFSIDND